MAVDRPSNLRSEDRAPRQAVPRIRTLAEVRADLAASPPREDLIDGLWGPDLTVLFGQPNAGKTWFALHMANAVTSASGCFLDRGAKGRARRIAYVGTDPGTDRKFADRAESLGLDESRFDVMTELPSPSDRDAWEAVVDQWQERKVDAVILDNLLGLLPDGANVNENNAVGPLLRRCEQVSRRGIAVLLIHHESKGQDVPGSRGTPLGSQYINAAARMTLRLVKETATRPSMLHVLDNNSLDAQLRLRLAAEQCELVDDEEVLSKKVRKTQRERSWDRQVELAHYLLSNAPPETLANPNRAGRWLFEQPGQKYTSTANGGRMLLRKLVEDLHLLARDTDGCLVAGPTLPHIGT